VKKSQSLFVLLGVFLAGFIAGVLFSSWKLGNVAGPSASAAPETAQPSAQDQIQQRISGIERMLAINPRNAEALVQLANDYFDLRKYDKAVETYKKALEMEPRNADVLTDMGICYRRLGHPNEAIEAFRKAVAVDPGHAMALFNMGIILKDDLKDKAGALKAWEAFLEKAGDSRYAVMVRPWVKQLREETGSTQGEKKDDEKK
jgi:cytochrome c-type biogenesis protein CcmH/NrfG